MRSLADGKIRWCFFPPDTTSDRTGKGVWLGGTEEEILEDSDAAISAVESLTSDDVEEDASEMPRRKSVHFDDEEQEEEDEDEDESSESEREMGGGAKNPFAALQFEDQSDEDDDDDDDDDDEDEDEDIKK
jgi:hypothetical protein